MRDKKAFQNLRRLELFIALTCICGVLICLYTIKVELYKAKDKNYVAFCDFGEFMSCSKVFSSK